MAFLYKNYSGCGYHHSCFGWANYGYKSYQPNCYSPNDVPFANNDTFTSNQGAVLRLSAASLLANDFDKNGDKLTISSVQASTNGTVVLVNGSVIFTPVSHYAGPASFTYTVSDGKGGSSTATVNVAVKPVNYLPDAVNDTITVASPHVEFVANKVTINPATLLANDKDANGDVLTVASVQCATNGTVALLNGRIEFTANAGYSGPATFTYTVSDGKGGYDTAVVCLTVPKTNVNPDAVNDAMDGNEDTPFVFLASTLLDNDTDANGDALTVQSVQGAVNGAVSMVNGQVTFTPNANFFGAASFTYTIVDGKGGVDTATVNLNICAVNDAPDAIDDGVFLVEQNTAITLSPATLSANDKDIDGDAFFGVSLQDATNGKVEFTNNQVVFTPDVNYVGAASFTYTIADAKGGFDTATVSLNVVAAKNTAPQAVADSVNTIEDTPIKLSFASLLANDKDVDGNALTIISVQAAQNGTVQIIDGQIVFAPAANYFGAASFTYTISDSKGGLSTALVNVNVASVLDLNIASAAISVSEEGLLGGNPDNIGSPQDNTNLSAVTGRLAIVDETGSASVTLLAPSANLSVGGQVVQWVGANTQNLIGTAGGAVVATLGIDNQGNYAFKLFKSLDHQANNVEDILQLNIDVNVSANGKTSSATLSINIEDDAPAVVSKNLDVSLINSNILIVLDTSSSMNELVAGQGKTKLDIAKESIASLLNAFDDAGEVRVRLVTFSSSSTIVGDKWFTKAEAFSAIESLQLNGATNYDAPLANAISAFSSEGKLNFAQNLSYFISDDDPNIGNGDESTLLGDRNFGADVGVQAAEEAEWASFLSLNQIKSYAIGVGDSIGSPDFLNPIAYDGHARKDTSAVIVIDPNRLGEVLLETTPSIENQALVSLPGADGGYVQALILDGVTYTFNTSGLLLTVAGGVNASTYDSQAGLYLFTLASGSRLAFNLADGVYDFKAPSSVASQSSIESFDYIVVDSEGDAGRSTVNINITQSVVLVSESSGGILSGGAGFDTLHGSDAQDDLNGLSGDDKIYANLGDDILRGGSGDDVLYGGAGADTFVWSLADKDVNAGVEKDSIRDFNPSADKLDLSDLLTGENNMNGIGNSLNYLSIEQSGANTIVHVSDNGGFSAGYTPANETLQITLHDANLLQLYVDEQTAIQNILKQTN